MARARPPVARVSANDLMDDVGRFKRPDELPRRVRRELEHCSVDGDGRIRGFRFRDRNRFAKFTLSKKRKKRRTSHAIDRELTRRLDEEIARLRAARQHGA